MFVQHYAFVHLNSHILQLLVKVETAYCFSCTSGTVMYLPTIYDKIFSSVNLTSTTRKENEFVFMAK